MRIKLLYLHPNMCLTLSAFFLIGCLMSRIVFNHCSSCILKVSGAALVRFWTQIKEYHLLDSVQDLFRAASATCRTQLKQIRTHQEQPQIRLEANREIWKLSEPQLKKLKNLLKIKRRLQFFKISGISYPSVTKIFKTTPLSDGSNLVSQSPWMAP